MIGMPRITLIRPALRLASTPMPDTRNIAQNSPSTVDNASEPMVTTMVSQTPCSRIGKNSTASLKNFCIGSDQGCVLRGEWCASGHQDASAFCPHFSRILPMAPLAFSLASEALILPSNSVSLLRTPIATVPTVTGL